jgi:hypothetical protein
MKVNDLLEGKTSLKLYEKGGNIVIPGLKEEVVHMSALPLLFLSWHHPHIMTSCCRM